jgi:hypothetical protein
LAVRKKESVHPAAAGKYTMDEILPPGFEKQVDNRGRTFYIDHNTQSTHWKLPEVMNIRYIYMPPSYSHP